MVASGAYSCFLSKLAAVRTSSAFENSAASAVGSSAAYFLIILTSSSVRNTLLPSFAFVGLQHAANSTKCHKRTYRSYTYQ